jgi:hypothetical protein
MRRVFKGGAVVALIAILIAPAIYADDPPVEPPSVRIRPPIGSEARLGPPGGGAAQNEPPTVFELFWAWLQVRIGPPIG